MINLPNSKTSIRKKEKFVSKGKGSPLVRTKKPEKLKPKAALKKEFKLKQDLKITNIRSEHWYAVPVYYIDAEDGSEWVAVKSMGDVEEIALDEIKECFDESGTEGFTSWIIENNLDTDRMFEDLSELMNHDIEEGVFKSEEAAEKFYREMVENPEDRKEFITEDQLKDYVDIDELADEALKADGAGHFLARYDGAIWEMDNGYVYWRVN